MQERSIERAQHRGKESLVKQINFRAKFVIKIYVLQFNRPTPYFDALCEQNKFLSVNLKRGAIRQVLVKRSF
jgi:hypothetical protein